MKKSYKKIIGLALCIIMCLGLLTACGSSELGEYENDPHALQSMLHNSGYQTVIEDGSYYNGEYVNGEYGPTFFNIETVVTCSNYSYEEAAVFFYCESEVDAEDNADNISGFFATNVSSINPIVKTSGKVVYVGTEGIWEHVISQAESSSGISIKTDLNISVVAIIVIIAVALLLIGGAILVGGIILIIIVIIIISLIKKKKKAKLAKLNSTQNSKTE